MRISIDRVFLLQGDKTKVSLDVDLVQYWVHGVYKGSLGVSYGIGDRLIQLVILE